MTCDEEVITPGAREFLGQLTARFEGRRQRLLAARRQAQKGFDVGRFPQERPATRAVRQWAWRCSAAGPESRQVEIVAPPEPEATSRALRSGADVLVVDFEDGARPTLDHALAGQRHLRTLAHDAGAAAQPALAVKPRGLHLHEADVLENGSAMSATLLDVGLFLFHDAEALRERGVHCHLVLPKIESFEEALWFDDVLTEAEAILGLPADHVQVTVLIETVPAAVQMDEILFALRRRATALTCGTWDYLLSWIKVVRAHPQHALPDRSALTEDQPLIRALVERLVRVCRARGVVAVGGAVLGDYEQVVDRGFEGVWVRSAEDVPRARESLRGGALQPEQGEVAPLPHVSFVGAQAPGARTFAGLRHTVEEGIRNLCALGDSGRLAVAETCRALVWHWVRHAAPFDDGRHATTALLADVITEVQEAWVDRPRVARAARLFHELCTAQEMIPLSATAYDRILLEEGA